MSAAATPAEQAQFALLAHRLGAPDRAIATAMQAGRSTQARWLRAVADHERALVGERAAAVLEQAAEEYAAMRLNICAAEVWVEAAEAHASTGHTSRSRRCWSRAHALRGAFERDVVTPILARLVAPSLTVREQQVAAQAARGRTNAEIAATLGRSVRTVEWHLQQAYMKLGINDRTELAGFVGVLNAPDES